jgi:hypothetical protein
MPPRRSIQAVKKRLSKPHRPHCIRYTTNSNGRLIKTRVPVVINRTRQGLEIVPGHAGTGASVLENVPVAIPAPDAGTRHEQPAPDHVAKENSYYARKCKEVANWTEVRDQLLHGYCALHVPKTGSATCSACQEVTPRVVLCLDCGPQLQWCKRCALAEHQLRPYHISVECKY